MRDYTRRLCRFPSRRQGAEIRRNVTASRSNPLQQVLESCNGTGPSPHKTPDSSDARVQTIPHRSDNDCWNRAGGKDEEASVQDWKVGEEADHDSGDLDSCSRRMIA
jgi:hypothetical protein